MPRRRPRPELWVNPRAGRTAAGAKMRIEIARLPPPKRVRAMKTMDEKAEKALKAKKAMEVKTEKAMKAMEVKAEKAEKALKAMKEKAEKTDKAMKSMKATALQPHMT